MQNNLLPTVVTPHFLTICPHPFLMERINRLVPFGLSIQEILDSIIDLPKECTTSVQVDGTPIHPDVWASYYPSEGSSIAIRAVPMGGEGGGKNPLRMILMLAVIVASIYTGGAVGAAYGAFSGALASAAVTMVGTLLVNALVPPAQARLTERAGVNVDGVVNSITNARNQANPFGPIPVLLGNHRIVPFYGARPYTEIVGGDQYLRLLFVPCYTPVSLSAFKIGETDLEDFEGVELEVKALETDADPTLYTNIVYEENVNVELLEVAGWTQRTTQTDTDEIIVDIICPNGLFAFNAAGNSTERIVYYEVQHAVKDSGAWVDLWDYFPINEQTPGPMGPNWNAYTIWGVLLNLHTRNAYVLEGQRGTYVPEYGIDIPPVSPPIPDGSCPLALITLPKLGSSVITDSMILDARGSCLDLENPDDFLVTANATPDHFVTVAAGSYRSRPFIKGQTSEVVRKAIRLKISNGQYDVRIRRITADSGDPLVYDDLYWSVLRSITYESPTDIENVAFIAMRIKATDQLSGIVDTFNCIGTSICKDWDTDTSQWIERVTANPASLYRYVLQHPSNKRAVADAKIDLTKLQEWHEFCQPVEVNPNAAGPAVDKGGGKVGIPCTDQPFSTDETIYIINSVAYNDRYIVDATSSANEIVITATYEAENFTGEESIHTIGLQYNSLIDYQSSITEVLQQIAAAGFASPTYVDGKYSVVIDQTQATPIQHFTPRNSWDFSGSKTYPRYPHALRIIFANRLTNWEIDERIVYADGYSVDGAGETDAATLFEQLELPGVTDPELAYILGRYHLAVLKLRPERYAFYADVENLVATRGDLIRVTHDVPLWGVATGRIKSITDNGTHATAVVMDSIMTMVFGNTYGIRFRLEDGSTLLAAIDTDVGNQTTLTFTTPILLANAPEVDDLGLFGETDEESVELLILSIEPGEDLTARIVCVDYSPAIYTASTGLIGEHDSHITPPYSDVGRSGIPEIYQIRSDESVMVIDSDGTVHIRMVITLLPVGGYVSRIQATEVSWKVYETDEPWQSFTLGGFMKELSILEVVSGTEYSIRLRFWVGGGGRGFVNPTQWSTVVQHTVIGRTSPPDVATGISATDVIGGVRIEWTNPAVLDFKATGIWRAEADVFPAGEPKYVIPGVPEEIMSFVDRDGSYLTTYYYWLKSYDTTGNVSSQTASVNGRPKYVESGAIADTIQSANFVSGVSGWFIGFRGDDDGYAEFNDVTVRGELVASEIHIPDKVTAGSFHVNTGGNAWWGCTEANFNANPENATAYVLSDGTCKLNVTVSLREVTVYGTKANIGSFNSGMLRVRDDNAMAANVGGAIGFEGQFTAAGAYALGASISCYKINADEADTSFGLQLNTRLNSELPSIALTINEHKNVGIGIVVPLNKLHVEGAGSGYAGIYLNDAIPGTTTNTLYNAAGILSWDGASIESGDLGATVGVASAGTLVITGNAHNVLLSGTTNFNGATIDGAEGPDGHLLVIRSTSTLTMTNDGNIKGRAALVFDSAYKTLVLMGIGGAWVELTRSDN